MNRKFFFIHNPKAGGTAIIKLISDLNIGKNICPPFLNSPNANDLIDEKIDYYLKFDIFSGHWGYNIFEKLGKNDVVITNFRSPVDRIYSLYRYWKYNICLNDIHHLDKKDYICVELSHKYNFSHFIRLDVKELNLYINNFHSRQLHSDGWKLFNLNQNIIENVKHRIENMDWFYVAEHPTRSMHLFRKAFPQFQHGSLTHENVSKGHSEKISDDDKNYLISLNYWDYEIYAYACKLQSERIKACCL